jgi:hypothetical protein
VTLAEILLFSSSKFFLFRLPRFESESDLWLLPMTSSSSSSSSLVFSSAVETSEVDAVRAVSSGNLIFRATDVDIEVDTKVGTEVDTEVGSNIRGCS